MFIDKSCFDILSVYQYLARCILTKCCFKKIKIKKSLKMCCICSNQGPSNQLQTPKVTWPACDYNSNFSARYCPTAVAGQWKNVL